MNKNELRRDPISGKWIIIINRKPEIEQFIQKAQLEQPARSDESCVFCEGREYETPAEVFALRPENSTSNEGGWRVRVIPETYPVLQIHGDLNNRGLGLYDMMDGIGAHEIIVESPKHGESFRNFSVHQFEDIFSVYKNRILDLKQDTRFRYVLLHKFQGHLDEAINNHASSHLIATPITPFGVKSELMNAEAHHAIKERCLFCDIIHQEQEMNQRIVLENESFIVLSPFAPQAAFHLMILPKRHETFFEWNSETHSLAEIFHTLWNRISSVLGDIRYVMAIHSGPNMSAGKHKNYWRTLEKDYHWHIEITPRLTSFSSFDAGSGFEINPVSPELATNLLKNNPAGD